MLIKESPFAKKELPRNLRWHDGRAGVVYFRSTLMNYFCPLAVDFRASGVVLVNRTEHNTFMVCFEL